MNMLRITGLTIIAWQLFLVGLLMCPRLSASEVQVPCCGPEDDDPVPAAIEVGRQAAIHRRDLIQDPGAILVEAVSLTRLSINIGWTNHVLDVNGRGAPGNHINVIYIRRVLHGNATPGLAVVVNPTTRIFPAGLSQHISDDAASPLAGLVQQEWIVRYSRTREQIHLAQGRMLMLLQAPEAEDQALWKACQMDLMTPQSHPPLTAKQEAELEAEIAELQKEMQEGDVLVDPRAPNNFRIAINRRLIAAQPSLYRASRLVFTFPMIARGTMPYRVDVQDHLDLSLLAVHLAEDKDQRADDLAANAQIWRDIGRVGATAVDELTHQQTLRTIVQDAPHHEWPQFLPKDLVTGNAAEFEELVSGLSAVMAGDPLPEALSPWATARLTYLFDIQ